MSGGGPASTLPSKVSSSCTPLGSYTNSCQSVVPDFGYPGAWLAQAEHPGVEGDGGLEIVGLDRAVEEAGDQHGAGSVSGLPVEQQHGGHRGEERGPRPREDRKSVV